MRISLIPHNKIWGARYRPLYPLENFLSEALDIEIGILHIRNYPQIFNSAVKKPIVVYSFYKAKDVKC